MIGLLCVTIFLLKLPPPARLPIALGLNLVNSIGKGYTARSGMDRSKTGLGTVADDDAAVAATKNVVKYGSKLV